MKIKKKSFCQCGKVETQEPLEECVSCTYCDGVIMHTWRDKIAHLRCGQVAPVIDTPEPAAPKIPKSRKEKPRAELSLENSTSQAWEMFFRSQRYPILRSQLITSLMVGVPYELERLPTATLLDAVLLTTAAREYLQAEIIDDYDGLLSRADDEWSKPDWTAARFDQINAMWAGVILKGVRNFDPPEVRWIPAFVNAVISSAVPEYFSEEFIDEGCDTRSGTATAAGKPRQKKSSRQAAGRRV
jgi:hypothetical protein